MYQPGSSARATMHASTPNKKITPHVPDRMRIGRAKLSRSLQQCQAVLLFQQLRARHLEKAVIVPGSICGVKIRWRGLAFIRVNSAGNLSQVGSAFEGEMIIRALHRQRYGIFETKYLPIGRTV